MVFSRKRDQGVSEDLVVRAVKKGEIKNMEKIKFIARLRRKSDGAVIPGEFEAERDLEAALWAANAAYGDDYSIIVVYPKEHALRIDFETRLPVIEDQ